MPAALPAASQLVVRMADSPGAATHALTMKGAQISWAILAGHKLIENRHMRMRPGWYLLHTGKGTQDAAHQQKMRGLCGAALPAEADLPHGVVVGALHVVRSLRPDECQGSVWASGPFCNVVGASCTLATPVAAQGSLGLWKPELAVLEAVRAQLADAPVLKNDVAHLLRAAPSAEELKHERSLVASQRRAEEAAQRRLDPQPCKYGAACYRTSPQHRQEYSHPPGHDAKLVAAAAAAAAASAASAPQPPATSTSASAAAGSPSPMATTAPAPAAAAAPTAAGGAGLSPAKEPKPEPEPNPNPSPSPAKRPLVTTGSPSPAKKARLAVSPKPKLAAADNPFSPARVAAVRAGPSNLPLTLTFNPGPHP